MSLWKKISLGVLIVLVLLLGTVGFLVGTTTGLHLVFKAADRWVPGLDIGKVTGGWRDLTLDNVRYEQPGVAVTAGRLLHKLSGCAAWGQQILCVRLTRAARYLRRNPSINKKMPPSALVEGGGQRTLNLSLTHYPITTSAARAAPTSATS